MKKECLASNDAETQADRSTAIRPLIDMLDYAMISGAELKLPKFVFLLRAASEELTDSLDQAVDDNEDAAGGDPPPDRS